MAMEVLHNTCNMCTHDLPGLSPQAYGPWALGIHIRRTPHAHVTAITYTVHFIDFCKLIHEKLHTLIGIQLFHACTCMSTKSNC